MRVALRADMLTTALVLLLSPISTCDVSVSESPLAAIVDVLASAPVACTPETLLEKLKQPITDETDVASYFACMKQGGGHSPEPQDGLHSVWQYGYPEEAGVYENGVRNGNFVYFGPDGTINKTERWENGVLVELRFYRGGRIDAIERWNAEGRRTENVLYNRGGYSKIVEHYAPGGHISWHEKWSRYTGDRITQVGPFNWR